jgi:tubulin alpha
MVDLPPDIIEEVKTSKFRDIFESNQFIHGKEDSSHNFARFVKNSVQFKLN